MADHAVGGFPEGLPYGDNFGCAPRFAMAAGFGGQLVGIGRDGWTVCAAANPGQGFDGANRAWMESIFAE